MTTDAINEFNFKKGTLLAFIFGYNRLIGSNQISSLCVPVIPVPGCGCGNGYCNTFGGF